ncbi:hypothetical protein GPECTOR_10g1016 [Gonium pectorale]|uniref:Uncharacterized protein n=1 Tax=Gonium pectorale TaxID=33097 RepID=A0A150GQC9_GONPE|nr:hypothetical protein GPECTOR_10g1016 [Gonium pectorale]|eukprot:KXZ51994.1 hypothetical protein GPECTOR_10g1016 [Gonium pectorale]
MNFYQEDDLLVPGWSDDELEGKKRTKARSGSGERPRGGKKPLRSRQRAIVSLEAELQQKQAAYQQALSEKQRLEQRIRVLEVVLPVRENQVQLLKQKAQHQSTPMLRITAAAETMSDSTQSSPAEELIAPQVVTPDPELAASNTQRRSPSPLEDFYLTANAPRSVQGGPCGTPAHILRQFISVWSHWVREAGLILHSHDARPNDPGPTLKLAALREGLMPKLRAMRLDYPCLIMDLVGLNMETGEREEPPSDNFWVSVVQALRFTPEQVAGCRAALELYRERITAVTTERRALKQQLSLCMAYGRPQQGRAGGAGATAAAAHSCGAQMLELLDVAAQLRRNVVVEGQAVEVAKDFMGSCLFSLVQSVRASVLCHPFFPDAISLLATVDQMASSGAGDTAVTLAR